jgi:hypothetical protein
MVRYAFHPDALLEYAAATNYYLGAASPAVAERFVTAVESAVTCIVADPARCRSSSSQGFVVFYSGAFLTFYTIVGRLIGFRHYLRHRALQPGAGILEAKNRLTENDSIRLECADERLGPN